MSTAMKRPLHANTHIYSLKLLGGLYCCRPSACQNLSLLNLLRNSSVHCDSFAIQFTFTKSICRLCTVATVGSKHGRRATSCCSTGLLKNKYFGMPGRWRGGGWGGVGMVRTDNEEAVKSWEFWGRCSHTKFLQIYIYKLSEEKTWPHNTYK